MKLLAISCFLVLLSSTISAQTFYQSLQGELMTESDYTHYRDSMLIAMKHGEKINNQSILVNFDINELERRGDSTILHFVPNTYYGFTKKQVSKSPLIHLGEPFPDFELEDLEGNVLRKSDLKGKKVFINFWFVTCYPCIAEIPDVQQIRDKYERDDVVFLAMTFEKAKKVEEFLEKKEFNLRHIPGAGKVIKGIDLSGFPQTIILDEEGNIQRIDNTLEGFFTEEVYAPLRASYERILGE